MDAWLEDHGLAVVVWAVLITGAVISVVQEWRGRERHPDPVVQEERRMPIFCGQCVDVIPRDQLEDHFMAQHGILVPPRFEEP